MGVCNCYLCVNKNVFLLLTRQVQANLPTSWGEFKLYAFAENHEDRQPHLALVHQKVDFKSSVAVRIHSECLTGDLFGSKRCDCGEQLNASMAIIAEKAGILIYLRQEGRGIGLINKMEAYNLQDQGMDTVQANVHLGFEPDERDFDIAIQILKDLGVHSIDLITNNPDKMAAIEYSPILMESRIPLVIAPRIENEIYLQTKMKKMGHLLQ